jgi:hypothetical protein
LPYTIRPFSGPPSTVPTNQRGPRRGPPHSIQYGPFRGHPPPAPAVPVLFLVLHSGGAVYRHTDTRGNIPTQFSKCYILLGIPVNVQKPRSPIRSSNLRGGGCSDVEGNGEIDVATRACSMCGVEWRHGKWWYGRGCVDWQVEAAVPEVGPLSM